ncbi:hypothetical protein SMALB_2238 [Streptomyces malaysiensis]|uniref:Uncharacterized protein n=1 Tax=Streptomyces malaysiensis TaxID=92644 RepID=A0A7X6AW17_STRMQ|nr:hypothetical protein [Streptomyces malaysiensis]
MFCEISKALVRGACWRRSKPEGQAARETAEQLREQISRLSEQPAAAERTIIRLAGHPRDRATTPPRSHDALLGTLFLTTESPEIIPLRRSRAGYGAHALGVTRLPADAKGLYRFLAQAAYGDQDARVPTACGNRPGEITSSPPFPCRMGSATPYSHPRRGSRADKGPYTS